MRRLCQTYILLLLLTITTLSSPPYMIVSLTLIFATLRFILRPPPPRLSVVISITTLFLIPLFLAPILHQITPMPAVVIELTSAIATLPVICLLDYHLRQNTPDVNLYPSGKEGRRVTGIYRALLAITLVLLATALVLDNRVLLAMVILFALYLMGITLLVFFTIPRSPLIPTGTWQRVIANTTVETTLDITGKATARITCRLRPADDWIKLVPERFALDKSIVKLTLSITPPLAGPARPTILAAVTDSRGMVQVNQILEPLELHVIPQARYAEWLARKYLEQSGGSATTTAALSPRELALPRRGIEYQDSRNYQPGDPLRGIDWKHTFKLQQLIVREFAEAGEPPGIIAVNLAVTSNEEADRLAFNLITTALTLAREHIPSVLTAYDHREVWLTTTVTEPEEILKRTLALTKNIIIVESIRQYLEAPDMARLKRNMSQLRQVDSEPAQRLLDMLNFEHRALEEAARNHPATTALTLATKQVTTPTVILLISQLNHDIEAILVNSEKLSRLKFTIIPLGNNL